MKRLIYKELVEWKNGPKYPPILLRGARQVGKTTIVELFGENEFDSFVKINFELQPKFKECFTDLDPNAILTQLMALTHQTILSKKTLLFLDEIQLCPQAIVSLRYFKELMPELHVIAAGSLLEFVMADEAFQMPVGRIRSMQMTPVSFKEFLIINQCHMAIEYIEQANPNKPIPLAIHTELDRLVRLYFILGGMPEVIADYQLTQDPLSAQIKQASILTTYRSDFGKYANRASQHKYLQLLMERIPSLSGQRFRYVHIDPDIRSRELKEPLELLRLAGIVHKIHHTNASGLPLQSQINHSVFKCLFLDIGLVQSTMMLSPNVLLNDDLMLINRGALAESFVGQELLAYLPSHMPLNLFYWEREKVGSQAEVDYVINVDQHIIPIEVKAGKTGSLRSLHVFMKEKNSPLGVRISQKPLEWRDNILTIPFYMIFELPRLVREWLE